MKGDGAGGAPDEVSGWALTTSADSTIIQPFPSTRLKSAQRDEPPWVHLTGGGGKIFGHQLRILQPRILTRHWMLDRLFKREGQAPFVRGADCIVLIDTVEAPEDFQPMPIGIAELDRDLHPGAAPAFEVDWHTDTAQVIARGHHFVQGRHFEGNVIELDVGRFFLHRTHQRDTVMIGIETHETHATRDHAVGIPIGDLEAEDFSIEPH